MSDRTRIEEPRGDCTREWEAFTRREETAPLRHVGSVTAPTAESAHDHASRLFPDAMAVWLCPSDEVARFTDRALGVGDGDAEDADDSGVEDGGRATGRADADGTAHATVPNAGVEP